MKLSICSTSCCRVGWVRMWRSGMTCPSCSATISTKHYDPDYEMYECPKCGGSFTPDEIDEAVSGTSPGKRRDESIRARLKRGLPVAKAKKRQTEIADDAEALAEFEKEQLKPRRSEEANRVQHRDEVPTKQ